jgi:Fe-S-cluster containining protein
VSYLPLLGELDAWFARGAANAAPGVIPCRPGCSACCHGPFDISSADAREVAIGLSALPAARRETLVDNALRQVVRYQLILPQWGAPWDVEQISEDDFDRICDALADAPCPALGETGSCLIYEHRPATCRMTGLPMLALSGDVIENVCPIQESFPAYAAFPPVLFDLEQFEAAAEVLNAQAELDGWTSTTVAGAVSRGGV